MWTHKHKVINSVQKISECVGVSLVPYVSYRYEVSFAYWSLNTNKYLLYRAENFIFRMCLKCGSGLDSYYICELEYILKVKKSFTPIQYQ